MKPDPIPSLIGELLLRTDLHPETRALIEAAKDTQEKAAVSDAIRLQLLKDKVAALQAGYGGVTPEGRIVDRRQEPNARTIPENSLLKTPKPK